jgi:hypothetical protein
MSVSRTQRENQRENEEDDQRQRKKEDDTQRQREKQRLQSAKTKRISSANAKTKRAISINAKKSQACNKEATKIRFRKVFEEDILNNNVPQPTFLLKGIMCARCAEYAAGSLLFFVAGKNS